mgnify:CR=1 FL=1|tara:strand:- start:6299 stop:6763 length:465 start_codon:yes stop_codon:yes gene_type:complete
MTFKKIYILILFLSITSLLGAIYIEYILQEKPCKLCLYQRIPYLIAIFICFFGYIFNKKLFWLYLLSVCFVISIFLSGYHVGIENNIFSEYSGCKVNNLNLTNKLEILESLKNSSPNCKDVNFNIFGLSLATINLIISVLIASFTIKVIINEKK